jgi:hypothetical protein
MMPNTCSNIFHLKFLRLFLGATRTNQTVALLTNIYANSSHLKHAANHLKLISTVRVQE